MSCVHASMPMGMGTWMGVVHVHVETQLQEAQSRSRFPALVMAHERVPDEELELDQEFSTRTYTLLEDEREVYIPDPSIYS